jgi:CBS domain-containing protein
MPSRSWRRAQSLREQSHVLQGLQESDSRRLALPLERFLLKLAMEAIMDVREIMTTPAHTIGVDDTLNCAAKLMREPALGCLPVIDDHGAVVGMISLDDIAHASRKPVLDPTPRFTADELGDVYDATSGRSKHQREHS